MKLSEFKEKIIEIHGKEKWERVENTDGFNIYNSSKEEQINEIKKDGSRLIYVGKPTDELIEMAIESMDNAYELVCLLCFMENDLDKTVKLSELRNMTLEEIKDLLEK